MGGSTQKSADGFQLSSVQGTTLQTNSTVQEMPVIRTLETKLSLESLKKSGVFSLEESRI